MSISLSQPQSDFLHLECKFPAFIAGLGSGKSFALIARALRDKFMFPAGVVAIYAPTYDLANLILVPRLIEALDSMKIPIQHNKTRNIISIPGYGSFIFRTMDKPGRIIGYESFRAHVDELDTLKIEHARLVWGKIIARNRQKLYGNPMNQVCVYTTPEGFNWAYDVYEHKAKLNSAYLKRHPNHAKEYRYITASTYSNQDNLSGDYIETLMGSYSPELIQAYLEGKWTNLKSGVVYRMFSITENNSIETIRPYETLFLGMDFNIERGCSVVHVKRGEYPHAVAEIVNTLDTLDTIEIIKERFAGHPIHIYADAYGTKRKSSDASVTDVKLLRDAGFYVHASLQNPRVRDRVNSMNSAFCNAKYARRYFVNTSACPAYTKALLQQAYDESGAPEKGEGKGDDILDAAGYFIHANYKAGKPINNSPVKIVGR